MGDSIYIAWVPFQRRLESMKSAFEYEVHYITSPFSASKLKILDYLVKTFKTLALFVNRRPRVVWIQLPPNFVPHVVLVAKALTFGRFKLVLDCHNASLRTPWVNIPGFRSIARRSDFCVVHNSEVLDQCLRLGVERNKVVVLEDPPAQFISDEKEDLGHVLVPCSFHDDEPIEELLFAARKVPARTIYITGNKARALKKGFVQTAPDNVVFTGFLPTEEFDHLLQTAGLVLGLTKFEGIQLSVANEAIGAGRALVLSKTKILEKMFSEAALFCSNTPDGLAAAIEDGLARRVELRALSNMQMHRTLEDWAGKAARLNADLR